MYEPAWAIVYTTNSQSKRARRWYHIARVIKVDGAWWELYWLESAAVARGANRAAIREEALNAGLALLHGEFTGAPSPRRGNELVWSLEDRKALSAYCIAQIVAN